MNNIDINFVESTLKVTASSDIDVSKDLESINTEHKSIETLLEENNDEKTK
jgi:hypothetical protein